MTTETEWEEVSVPAGAFVKWTTPGDTVTGWVISYHPTEGASTFDGDACGHLVLDDQETREARKITLDKGALRDPVAAAAPTVGLLMQVTYTGDKESATGRTYKAFSVKVARGVTAPERPAAVDEEPF